MTKKMSIFNRGAFGLAVLASALLLLPSCGGRRQPETLTLMTYNVGVFSKYEENSTADVARLILSQGASLVSLNELDSCNRRHDAYQLKDLADALGGWSYQFASAFPYAGGAYGNGVVSAKKILSRYRIPLPQGDGSEPRSVAVVETEDCVFAAVHLDHRSKDAALEQMRVVNEWFKKVYSGCSKPVFLCGDFNVTPDSEVIGLAKTEWILLSREGFTHPSRNPRHCIDYIFSFRDAVHVEVLTARVLTEGTQDLSDHLPVLVTVKY